MKNKLPIVISLLLGMLVIFGAFYLAKNNSVQSSPSQQEQATLKTIPTQEFKNKISQTQDAIIIDVRTPEEYAQVHIKSAINIDFYEKDFPNKLEKLDKEKTYLIYCRSGNRSGQTLNLMRQMGFKKVYDLQGGIKAWMASGFELVK